MPEIAVKEENLLPGWKVNRVLQGNVLVSSIDDENALRQTHIPAAKRMEEKYFAIGKGEAFYEIAKGVNPNCAFIDMLDGKIVCQDVDRGVMMTLLNSLRDRYEKDLANAAGKELAEPRIKGKVQAIVDVEKALLLKQQGRKARKN
jgi:hypothetical protein